MIKWTLCIKRQSFFLKFQNLKKIGVLNESAESIYGLGFTYRYEESKLLKFSFKL